MKAGKLDRIIKVQKYSSTIDPGSGQPIPAWTDLGEFRAEVVKGSTEEFMRNFGVLEQTTTVFRIRYVEGIALSDRVVYQGEAHGIAEIMEIGRRRGLELRTVGSGEEAS